MPPLSNEDVTVPTAIAAAALALVYLTMSIRCATLFHAMGGVASLPSYPVAILVEDCAIATIIFIGWHHVPTATLFIFSVGVLFTMWIAISGVGEQHDALHPMAAGTVTLVRHERNE